MNCETAYTKVYDILGEYYFVTDEYYDQLGSMLGDMYPSLFGEEKQFGSFDSTVYDDWTKAWDRIVGKGKDATPKQVVKVAKTILDYYEKQVEYEIGEAEAFLREKLGA